MTDQLDQPCSGCMRPVGEHTVREWFACSGRLTTDLPYEDSPPDIAAATSASVRERFGIDDDVMVADHIVAHALTFAGQAGPLRVVYPAVLHEFQVGVHGRPPETIAKVMFLGSAESVKQYGRLLRDTSNGAVNAAGRLSA